MKYLKYPHWTEGNGPNMTEKHLKGPKCDEF